MGFHFSHKDLIFCRQCCAAGAEEPILNCLPEPSLRILALAPFYLPQTGRNFIE